MWILVHPNAFSAVEAVAPSLAPQVYLLRESTPFLRRLVWRPKFTYLGYLWRLVWRPKFTYLGYLWRLVWRHLDPSIPSGTIRGLWRDCAIFADAASSAYWGATPGDRLIQGLQNGRGARYAINWEECDA